MINKMINMCINVFHLSDLDETHPKSVLVVNPLSPNSDQHQFSPNNIHTMSRD